MNLSYNIKSIFPSFLFLPVVQVTTYSLSHGRNAITSWQGFLQSTGKAFCKATCPGISSAWNSWGMFTSPNWLVGSWVTYFLRLSLASHMPPLCNLFTNHTTLCLLHEYSMYTPVIAFVSGALITILCHSLN